MNFLHYKKNQTINILPLSYRRPFN